MASVSPAYRLEPPAAAQRTGADGDELRSIATLRAGHDVEAVFACARVERQISRAGTPYLTVELRDRTGTITGRAFRDADLLAGRFERGDLVRVSGRVKRWGEELQLELHAIARVAPGEADPAAFLPSSYRDGVLEQPAHVGVVRRASGSASAGARRYARRAPYLGA